MFKVYLIDDEEWLISELKNIIDWKAYGFEICGYNTDSLEAEKEVLALNPSLVICDVRMDGMTGLELATAIHEKAPNISFCFLSAYDKFEYAVSAMKLGAVDYLTKPIKTDALVSVLEKFKSAKLDALGAGIAELAAGGGSSAGESMYAVLREANIMSDGVKARCAVVCGEGKDFDLSKVAQTAFRLFAGENENVWFLIGADISKLERASSNGGFSVGLSSEFSTADELSKCVGTAMICSKQSFITGRDSVTEYAPNPRVEDILKTVYFAGSKHELKNLVSGLASTVKKHDVKIYDLDRIFHAVAFAAVRLGVSGFEGNLAGKRVTELYDSLAAMTADLEEKLASPTGGRMNAAVESVLKDVTESYSEKQSLAAYANKYGFNTSYLSWLFKKQIGKNFVEYVLELRIGKAKELMADTDKTMHEIAYAVGYDDYFHFSKLFKKHEGLSPTEYKKKFFPR